MLPITRHRTLVIPHRLALIAAAVCLALAFTSDRNTVEGPQQADRSQPLEQLEAVSSSPASVRQGDQPGKAQPGKSRGSGRNPSLLPWFSGLMHR